MGNIEHWSADKIAEIGSRLRIRHSYHAYSNEVVRNVLAEAAAVPHGDQGAVEAIRAHKAAKLGHEGAQPADWALWEAVGLSPERGQ